MPPRNGTHSIWIVALAWGNPYTQPPGDLPRVLVEGTVERESQQGAPVRDEFPEAVRDVLDGRVSPHGHTYRPGDGFGLYVGKDRTVEEAKASGKKWPKERKAARRQANLRARLERRVGPLFAHEVPALIEAAIEARPRYFGGEDPPWEVTPDWLKSPRKQRKSSSFTSINAVTAPTP